MTAGEDALREAARLESARIYGQVQREHHSADDVQPTVVAAVVEPPTTKAVQRIRPDAARVSELRERYYERLRESS